MTQPLRSQPPQHYTDPAFFAQEQDAIFFKTWLFAAHESQVRDPGDYHCFEVAGQNLFLLRGRDGRVRCFYNVCQHRAHELLEGSGSRRVLVCPYHAWTYDLTGRLMKAPNDRKVEGFQRQEICLEEVRVESFHGFLFVNLDPDAAPMEAWYPGVHEALAAYVPSIDDLQPVQWMTLQEDCNWKISVENYSECYHCALTHPTFVSGVVDPESYNVAENGGYCLRHTTKAANLDRMSYPIDLEANAHVTEYSSWFLWPTFSFQVYPGNVLNTYLWRPEAVDRVEVARGWYTVGGIESSDIERLAQQDMNTTVAEDVRLVESVQRGLRSRGFRPAPLIIDPNEGVRSEHSLAALYRWWDEAIAGDLAPGGTAEVRTAS